ncbi:MAG: sensor histidine kinase, partial [Flavobacterium sp.]
ILKEQKLVIAEEIEMADGRILERSYIPILKDKKYDGHLWNYVDVTIKKRYEQSLEIEKTKYSSIIDNMNMGLLEVDNKDVIQLANQSFCLMSGYKKSELIGKNASTIFLDEMNKKIIKNKLLDRTIKSIADSYEIDIKNKSKEIRHWMISGAPNFNLNGEVIGSIGIHLDITEKKKLEIQKEELLLKLEKQNESLNDYAHMISHDLKSPLRSIHTLISWIKEEKDMLFTENGKKYMGMLIEKVEKMDNLIDGVLTISKLDTIEYKYQEVDLNEILNIVISIIHIPSHVTIKITNKFPTIYTDKYRIQQLFQNLISNAVNYSNKKEGKVTITYKDIDDFHLFSIKDNGIGIEKSYHEKIFDIFESYSDDSKSSGIGLSIVKKIIQNYKGEIWLESELNKGTTFYFKIPKINNGST